MTMKIAFAMFLVCAAQTSAKFKTPLLAKGPWKIVDEFLSVQTESKFIATHRNFGQFSGKYKDLSDEIKKQLRSTEMDWLFFKDLETDKIIAENIEEQCEYGRTALHQVAIWTDDAKIATALIEAGIDVNAQSWCNRTALHYAAAHDHLEIGKFLVEAGARLDLRTNKNWMTPLEIAVLYGHNNFAKMLRAHQK